MAERVGRLDPEAAGVATREASVPEQVLIAVQTLLSGESHCVSRPGLIELRRNLAQAAWSAPRR